MTQQYRFALNGAGFLVDVQRLTEANRAEYKCADCGGPMVLVLPKLDIVKHFRHKSGSTCTGESYLHKVAKQAFKQSFNYYAKRSGFFVELAGERYKISDAYTDIVLEKRQGDGIPDITILSTDNRKILVEMAVTHFVKPFTATMRMYPTIEIRIEEEADIELLREPYIDLDSDRVNYYHNGIDTGAYLTGRYYLTERQWRYVDREGVDRLRTVEESTPSIMCAILETGMLKDGRINMDKLAWLERESQARSARAQEIEDITSRLMSHEKKAVIDKETAMNNLAELKKLRRVAKERGIIS